MGMQKPTDEKLAEALGWGSLGLGLPMTLAPERFLRLIGVRPDRKAKAWMLAVGIREHAHAAGILAIEKPRPVITMWTRVAGDVKDSALLVSALRNKPESNLRLFMSMALATLIGALDVYTAMRLSRQDGESQSDETSQAQATGHPRDEAPRRMPTRTAATIRKPRDEVERQWQEYLSDGALEWPQEARVMFRAAPGDRGTEIHVELMPQPGHTIGKAVAKVQGEDPMQRAGDNLRRFKMLVETGNIVRSDGTPEGPLSKRLLKQRPAQPLETVEALA
jgi:hypothetical protein